MIAMTGFFKVQGNGEGAAAGIQRACIWRKAEKTGYSGAAVLNSAAAGNPCRVLRKINGEEEKC